MMAPSAAAGDFNVPPACYPKPTKILASVLHGPRDLHLVRP